MSLGHSVFISDIYRDIRLRLHVSLLRHVDVHRRRRYSYIMSQIWKVMSHIFMSHVTHLRDRILGSSVSGIRIASASVYSYIDIQATCIHMDIPMSLLMAASCLHVDIYMYIYGYIHTYEIFICVCTCRMYIWDIHMYIWDIHMCLYMSWLRHIFEKYLEDAREIFIWVATDSRID